VQADIYKINNDRVVRGSRGSVQLPCYQRARFLFSVSVSKVSDRPSDRAVSIKEIRRQPKVSDTGKQEAAAERWGGVKSEENHKKKDDEEEEEGKAARLLTQRRVPRYRDAARRLPSRRPKRNLG